MIIRWSDNRAQSVRRQNFLFRGQPFLNNYISVAVIPPIDDSGFFSRAALSGDQFIKGVLSGAVIGRATLSRLIFSRSFLNG